MNQQPLNPIKPTSTWNIAMFINFSGGNTSSWFCCLLSFWYLGHVLFKILPGISGELTRLRHTSRLQNPYRSSHGFNPSHETACFLKDSIWPLCSLVELEKTHLRRCWKSSPVRKSKNLEGDAINITLWNTEDTCQAFLQRNLKGWGAQVALQKRFLKERYARYAVNFRRNNKEQGSSLSLLHGFYYL